MTQEQRRQTRDALARYGQRGSRMKRDGWAWAQAIDEARDYYREQDPFLRGQLLQLRYLEHRTVEDTMERLRVGKSTYQKADSDLLSTVAINAARYGLL